MPAPAANNNAEKWTLQTTLTKLEKILDEAQSPYVHHLGRALQCADIYQGVWTYWKKKWALSEEVMEKIYFIEQIFINKTIESGMSKRMPASVCLFILRTNYGMNDKKETQEKLPSHLAPEFAPEPQPEPEPKPAKKEKEAAAQPPAKAPEPTTEECLSDNPPYGKDFRPRASDNPIEAQLRARAAKSPYRHYSVEPPSGKGLPNYMILAEELYKTL